MSSVNKDSFCFFFSSLLSYINISFSCLPPWCLIRVVRLDILSLFLIMEETSWAFSVRCDVCCRFCMCVCVCVCVYWINALYQAEEVPLYFYFSKSIIHEWMSNFVKCLFLCWFMNSCAFLLQFVNMLYY